MKTLFKIDLDCDLGTLFVAENGDYVGYFHENDANWRDEYMDFIPKYFGGQMVSLNVNQDALNEEADCGEKIHKDLKEEITKAISKKNYHY